jgi:hypothetical protein
LRYALRLAKKTLNKYYSLTDEAEVYRITMGKISLAYQRTLLIGMQFFTPNTNLTTFGQPVGPLIGLIPQNL